MKEFIDTNIFVYAYDARDRRKQVIARELLRRVEAGGAGVVSLQVEQEFFWTATRKLDLDPLTAKAILKRWTSFEVVAPSEAMLFEAIDCSVTDGVSFWDALVVTAAAAARCAHLYSEDMSHRQVIRSVRIIDPFR